MRKKILAIIQARSGSKRIHNKNIKNFLGKPLIVYIIKQARSLDLVDRVVVDTDSPKIAKIAEKYGAEVPFMRPKHLATNTAQGIDSILYVVNKLKSDEKYLPSHVVILPVTAPLREEEDIRNCWNMMQNTNADTVLTVCHTHQRQYYLNSQKNIVLVTGSKKERKSTNSQDWRSAYRINGGVFLVKTKALLRERNDITKKTKAVICPKWRSIDIDTPEDFVIAEVLYKNKKSISMRIKNMENKGR